MSVSVIVPLGCADQPERRELWGWLSARYEALHPTWQVVEARDPEDGRLWSKGRVVAAAIDDADGDVLVITDADSFIDAGTLTEAADYLHVYGEYSWVVPFGKVFRLSPDWTRRIVAGPIDVEPTHRHHDELARPPYRGVPGGGIVVLTRDAYDRVGGFDPRFTGWGGEDRAFACALKALVGLYHRLEAPLWHLWHPPAQPDSNRMPEANISLLHRYRSATTVPSRMRALIEERAQEA